MTPREIATKIVNQAMRHPEAIETKVSPATLLIGIEVELAAERERCAKIAEGYARANHNLNTNPQEAANAIAVSNAIAATIRKDYPDGKETAKTHRSPPTD